MANKKKNENKRNEIIGTLLIGIALFIAITIYFNVDSIFGTVIKDVVFGISGIVGFAIPMLIGFVGVLFIISHKKKRNYLKLGLVWLTVFFLFSLFNLGIVEEASKQASDNYASFLDACYLIGATRCVGGGLIGSLLTYWTYTFLGIVGSYIVCLTGILACILALTNLSLKKAGLHLGNAVKSTYNDYRVKSEQRNSEKGLYIENLKKTQFNDNIQKKNIEDQFDLKIQQVNNMTEELKLKIHETEEKTPKITYDPMQYREVFSDTNIEFNDKPSPKKRSGKRKIELEQFPSTPEQEAGVNNTANKIKQMPISRQTKPIPIVRERGNLPEGQYIPPPLNLLSQTEEADKDSTQEIKQKAEILIRTLQEFKITAKIADIFQGPVITRIEIQPAPGVKVAKIVNLADDLAMNLSAKYVRIEAPVPGKPVVGIEIPNTHTSMVGLRDLLASEKFRNAKSPLSFAVGKDIAGENVYADIAKMPHMLIAGSTGAGKSVCINSLITSILYHSGPEDVKMIMVDPKVVELNVYNGIPHLLIPVVTDCKKAASALNWAVREMETRYKSFAQRGVRELTKYNQIMLKEGQEKLPYILVIVDELADLMMVASKDVEDAICRIAQLGRASGIHLVIATQRPSVDVITGIIKANIASRIAFAVSSQIDSRTILDAAGAEKLLGHGDMLFSPSGVQKPLRVQGCFISDIEVEEVTNYLKQRTDVKYEAQIIEGIEKEAVSESINADQTDDMFNKAVETVLEYEQASASMLQRRLRIGFARAARLIDEMEERGYVGPSVGGKARQVLITKEMYKSICNNESDNQDENDGNFAGGGEGIGN